ncbi:hypothetical protein SAMN05443247_07911 [Bradyrhizobium erythrophlei]|nr:hypothetical protein SAMN05443247_07911 [Bradyrhizobium erythrophlei]
MPKLSNRAIAKVLGVDESTLRADAAGNPASDKKKSNEAKGGSVPPAGNPAPGLSGAAAAAAVASKENKDERQAAKDQKRVEDDFSAFSPIASGERYLTSPAGRRMGGSC